MELELGVRITRSVGNLTFTTTETDAIVLLLAHLPGFEKDEIEIHINEAKTEISISGGGHVESLQEVNISRTVNIAREVGIERFCQAFSIPDGVDFERIDAEFDEDNEILIILMPKLVREEISPAAATAVMEQNEREEAAGTSKEQTVEPETATRPREEPYAITLESVEPLHQDVDLGPTEALDSNEAAEIAKGEKIPDDRFAQGEILEEKETPEEVREQEIPALEILDQAREQESVEAPEIETSEQSQGKEPCDEKLLLPDVETSDQAPEIEAADSHQEQEISAGETPDQATGFRTTDPHQDVEHGPVLAREREIPSRETPEEAPGIKAADLHQDEEVPDIGKSDRPPEIESYEQDAIEGVIVTPEPPDRVPETVNSQEPDQIGEDKEAIQSTESPPEIESYELETTEGAILTPEPPDRVPETVKSQEADQIGEDKEAIQSTESGELPDQNLKQEDQSPTVETEDQPPKSLKSIQIPEQERDTTRSAELEESEQSLQQEDGTTTAKTEDRQPEPREEQHRESRAETELRESSANDSDKDEGIDEIEGDTEKTREKRRRRRLRRTPSSSLNPSSLLAGSAFVFSFAVLAFHFLRGRRRN